MKKNYKERVVYIFLIVVLLALPLKVGSAVAQTSELDSTTKETTTSTQNLNSIIKNSDSEPTNSMESSTTRGADSSESELSIHQEKTIQLKVNQELTSDMIEDAVTINNKLKDSTLEFLPEETLFSTTGEKTVNIKIIEKNTNEEKEIEAPITVSVERVRGISAEPNPQKLLLGSDSSMWDLSEFVDKVNINGEYVGKESYIVEYSNDPTNFEIDTSIVGIGWFKVYVYDKDKTQSCLVVVPYEKVLNNSVLFYANPTDDYGSSTSGNTRMSGVYTLLDTNPPVIASALGYPRNPGDVNVHTDPSLNQNDIYYTFNWFDLSSKNSYLLKDDAKGTKYVEAKGTDNLFTKLDSWGTNRKQEVHYGDVVRIYVPYPISRLTVVSPSGDFTLGANGYYEITPNGYQKIRINNAVTKKQKLSIGASDKEVIDSIDQSIELQKGQTARFIKLPPREKIGDTEGIIRVSQKLNAGKTIEYDYTVPFEIVKDEMTVKTKGNANFILGQSTDDFDYKKFVQEVKIGSKILNKNEYDVTLLSKIENEISDVNRTEIRLKVSSELSSNVIETTIPVNVSWGQSIAFGGLEIASIPSEARTTGAYTLQLDDKPQIVATPGNREGLDSQIHYRFTNEDYYKVDYFNMRTNRKIKDTDKGNKSVTAQGQQYPREPVDEWGRVDVNYGDIIRSFGAEKSRHWVYEGDEQKQSFARKNNDYLYYEITKQGYSLLEINRLNTKKVKVPVNSSKEYLDSIKESFFTNLTANKVNVVGFSNYPDTSKPTSSGTLEVSEKLTTGKTVTYAYEVTIGTTYSISEQAVDEKNNPLAKEKITVVDSTDSYQPKPDKFLDKNGTVYKYFGYSYTNDSTSQQETIVGMPNQTFHSNTKIKYFYKNTDKLINVTLPTDLVFGTYDGSKKVTAKNYQIRNNSEEIKTNVVFEKFEKVQSNVKLLSNMEKEPSKEENSAKLNLLIDNQPAIKGLNETTQSQGIKELAPKSATNLSIDGQYYGKMSEKNIVQYKTKLKFKALAD